MTGIRAFVASFVPPGLSFRDPLLLTLLALVPLAIALKILREKRGDGALVVPTLANVAGVRRTWRVRFRLLPFALALVGYSGLVVALARPRLGLERTESWTEGVDIFIALDASGSMAAEDFKPKNRFAVGAPRHLSVGNCQRVRQPQVPSAPLATPISLIRFDNMVIIAFCSNSEIKINISFRY